VAIHPDDIPPEFRDAVLGALEKGVVQGPGKSDGPPPDVAILEQVNYAATSYYRSNESRYYRGLAKQASASGWPKDLPELCVALSGGGIRAAMFGMGVLEGLQQGEVLDNVDLVSSVSGGSYANLWLVDQGLREYDPETYQRYHKPKKPRPFLTKAGWFVDALLSALFLPVSVARDYIVLPRNTSPRFGLFHYGYEGSIRRYFGGFSSFDYLNLKQLRPSLEEGHYPLPIVNATAVRGETGCDALHREHSWFDTVFEVTPLRAGSEGLGFTDNKFLNRLTLNQAVAVSGAAVDRPDTAWCKRRAAAGLKLGAMIPAYSGAERIVSTASLQDYAPIRQPPPRLALADGGFTDNLGVFSVVKRLCKTTIVVDASFDPALTFHALYQLEKHLQDELGVQLRSDDHGSGEAWGRDLLQFAEKNRTAVCEKLAQINGDGRGCHRCVDRGRPDWARRETLRNIAWHPAQSLLEAAWIDQFRLPVFGAAIGPFPYPGRSSPLMLRLIYIKLAMTDWLVGSTEPDLGPAQELFWKETMKHCDCEPGWYGGIRCPFPQTQTHEQDYSKRRVDAYRSLGRVLGKEVAEHQHPR
jgi:hypothetical protein